MDINEQADQVILILRGKARIKVGDEEKTLVPGFSILVPAGVVYHIYNTGEKPLFIYQVTASTM